MARRRNSRRTSPTYSIPPKVVRNRTHSTPLSINVYVPVPRNFPRTVIYRPPQQYQSRRRHIRKAINVTRKGLVRRKVKVIVPRIAPAASAGKVELRPPTRRGSPGRMTVYSRNNTDRTLMFEENRRRRDERKQRRRKYRNGQIDSPGSLRGGLVAESLRRGYDLQTVADAAMVARSKWF